MNPNIVSNAKMAVNKCEEEKIFFKIKNDEVLHRFLYSTLNKSKQQGKMPWKDR
jgi:hypothetical protein